MSMSSVSCGAYSKDRLNRLLTGYPFDSLALEGEIHIATENNPGFAFANANYLKRTRF